MATSPASTPRRNRDAHVIAAAVEVMSERGYAATSIQEVADRVGVLKGSLYHYFPSKEELLVRILTESHEEDVAIKERVKAMHLSAFDELVTYLREASRWYLNNVERANIYFSERRHLTGARLEEALLDGREYERYIENLIRQAQADGDIRSDLSDRLISRSVLGSINNVRTWRSRPGRTQIPTDEIIEAFISLTRSAIQA